MHRDMHNEVQQLIRPFDTKVSEESLRKEASRTQDNQDKKPEVYDGTLRIFYLDYPK